MWYLRVALQFIAWFPVFEMILPLFDDGDGGHFSLLVIGTVVSIAFRNVLMNKQIQRVASTPLWKSNLPREKREALFVVITSSKPTDINNFDEIVTRYVSLPTKVAGGVMYGIVHLLHQHLADDDKMKLMAVFGAFVVGGTGINGTRHGSIGIDCFFRCMFGAAYIGILHYLAEVSDIVLIKGIK
eukprot:CAMPEP_0181116814 /NCGR_PEP_ID=MMETSP1071-20121207/22155_1 /TAXON_ID=35127 /ORGANISM="Thalassiosira sp., Strain NH16" /LENGTH=184 /DNA_ID=CAMNT_0023201091 /DNA_START=202 /DNA_END=756 /DNA_ORIENTATION=-